MTKTKENCRKQTGNLKINNKLYPIYEGLNIIGRDAKATIVLKETIFSKLHAAISVVDTNTHLICDLNSSNGTQLGKLKLVPYKFYSINDHESIIFGDVVGMYFKGTELQNNCVNKSSQNIDHEASTQILNNLNNIVENLHELPTQPFIVDVDAPTQSLIEPNKIENLHEASTQIFGDRVEKSFNIHEAPTQIFPETNNTSKNNIHEAPTQYFESNESEKKIDDDDDDDDATQDLDPKISEEKTNEEVGAIQELDSKISEEKTDEEVDATQELGSKISEEKTDEEVDATQELLGSKILEEKTDEEVDTTQELDSKISEEKTDEEVPNTQDDDDLLSRTDVYDDIFANESFRSSLERSAAVEEEKIAVEVDETVLVESEFKKPENPELETKVNNIDEIGDDDDIILSTQDTEIIDQKYREHQDQINSSTDKLDEKVEEVSDSDVTDVEDELLAVNVENISCLEEVTKTPEIVEENLPGNEDVHENDIHENSDEEEIDLLASVTVASKSESNTEESLKNNESFAKEAENINVNELAPTQLLTSKEPNNSSDDETDDELPATQLLPLMNQKQTSNTDVFLAPTQLLIQHSAEKSSKTNDEDDVYLAATQKLPLTSDDFCVNGGEVQTSSPVSKNEPDIFSAETQFFPPDKVNETNETSENNTHGDASIYSAPTQVFQLEKNEDDVYSAATQILPLGNEIQETPEILKPKETSKIQVENEEEDIFSAATQILPAATKISKPKSPIGNQIQNGEESIFSAATQLLAAESSDPSTVSLPQLTNHEDEIFMAPTQILLDDSESIKNTGTSNVRLSSETIDEVSMHLHLSETEPSTSNLNFNHEEEKLLHEREQEQQQNTETQLEVSFELETQKLYVEEKTRRPDNPLSHLFAEQATEMTEQYDMENLNDKIEDDDKNEDLNTSIENSKKLIPIVSIVDIKKSKITLKDIQEASTSKIKKSYVKLERIKQEPTRRSNRNTKLPGKPDENEKFSPESELTEEIIKELPNEEVKVKTKRRTKYPVTPKTKIPEIQEEINSEATKEENGTAEEKTVKRKKKIVSEEAVQNLESENNSEDADFKMSATNNFFHHNTRGKRRDYKNISKGKMEDENEAKNAKGRITSKSFMREKIEELEIHIKKDTSPRSPTKRSATKSVEASDSDDSVFRSKRSKRNQSKENNKDKEKVPEKKITVEDTDESSIEINIRKKVPIIEDSEETVPRPKRNRKQMSKPKHEAETIVKETEKTRDEHLGRNKRVPRNGRKISKRKEDEDKMGLLIEDSDESILASNEKIENNEAPESVTRTIQLPQTRKRNSQLSPERNKQNLNDICLNTPNSKRRKYEPLCVNISSNQFNNDNESEHKVVFTMLNDSNLENVVQKLGGSVVDSIHACTVLVTNKISRSLKFLIAVALAKPIVHVKWISDSEKRKKFLDPWDYLLEDIESETKFKMSLKDSLTISRNKKLLLGETIVLAAAKNFDVLKEIIETSGGKCITRAPPKNSKAVVVCYEDEKSKYSRYLKQKTLIVVSAEAIFSGVLQQKLNWKQYLLT